MDLFAHARKAQIEQESPLANRMRPRTLDEYVGQQHIIGKGRLLRRAIEADQLSSLIFYGPPGTGKTTLASVIANQTKSQFISINAVLSGVKQIREAIELAEDRRNMHNQRTTLFVDEVHRWNKAQQDALLPHVEKGTVILIGATTENPYFEVNKALVSRSRIFQLQPLTEDDLRKIAYQAIHDVKRGYGMLNVEIEAEALDHLVDVANGDARGVLNALELAVETTVPDETGVIRIDVPTAEESIQKRAVLYDKDGDTHYDTISAFIKSLRGSDPDAALYWMAKMLYAGEDARFIFRRMAILASEDVGLADPQAAGVVHSCWQIYERIGMPEGRFPLAQAALYLATCPKSNSTMAFFDALATVEKEQEGEVPNPLKDGTRDKDGFGHGKGYLYPHAYQDHWVAQQYLPAFLQGKTFYNPSDQGYEAQIADQVAQRREAQLAAMLEMEEDALPEIFSTSPTDHRKDAWLQRALARGSQNLSGVRDKIFALAKISRHHTVLVLNEETGLLAWEAVRQTPEGGVWVLAKNEQAQTALNQQAQRLPELDRPHIVLSLDDIDQPFDHALTRNPVVGGKWLFNLQTLTCNLQSLTFAQTIPRHAQRLYQLVDWSGLDAGIFQIVQATEDAIYQSPDNPMVNWDVPDLVGQLEDAGFDEVKVEVVRQVEQRQFGLGDLERWFEGSYGDGLRNAGINSTQLIQIQTRYRQTFLNKPVSWQTTIAYIMAKK